MMNRRWRFLSYSFQTAGMNMAIDEAVAEAISFNEAPPTVRFYGWNPSAVSIGCFQELEKEVDLAKCRELGVDVVRRRTGGGAVYHDRDGEITYSVICPETIMEKDINAAYRRICGLVVKALFRLDIQAAFRPVNDIVVGDRKISGSAQTRRSGIFTQHGTVLYAVDRARMFSLLRPDMEKVASKGALSPGDLVTSVSESSKATKEELLAALEDAFLEDRDWFPGELSQDERSRAEAIAKERYLDDGWTRSR